MLPNFTIVICGAILTVMMLAVTGSGLVTPETRTRIGEMPEVGRPMMQRMISEPAGQAQFAALELSRRADEIGRLRVLNRIDRCGSILDRHAQGPGNVPLDGLFSEISLQ